MPDLGPLFFYHRVEAAGWNAYIDGKPYDNPFNPVTDGPAITRQVNSATVEIIPAKILRDGDSVRATFWAKGYLESKVSCDRKPSSRRSRVFGVWRNWWSQQKDEK